MKPKLAIGIKEFAVIGHQLMYGYVHIHNARAHASVFTRVIAIEREICHSQLHVASAHEYEECLMNERVTCCTADFELMILGEIT